MKAKAYSPCLGCLIRTHSRNDAVLSFAGLTAPLTWQKAAPQHQIDTIFLPMYIGNTSEKAPDTKYWLA